jgi:hypothetical protein
MAIAPTDKVACVSINAAQVTLAGLWLSGPAFADRQSPP